MWLVILLDPCLNKATEEQALNRIYRIGQTRETHVHKLVSCWIVDFQSQLFVV